MRTEVVIAGAGVVGLAMARELGSHYGDDVALLEQHPTVGSESSSRNSEVIHAGLYYPPGSLKAFHCLRGREMLYDYCRRHAIPFRRTGKLIVADAAGQSRLREIHDNAIASGVDPRQLEWLDRAGVQALEPAVAADVALHSKPTGIIDGHSLMQTLLDEALDHGVIHAPCTRVHGVRATPAGYRLTLSSGSRSEPAQLDCRVLINCAGLGATTLASHIEGFPAEQIPDVQLVKGSYFSYQGRAPFSRLIYPLPEAGTRGLGIHATLDMAGQLRFGPDAQTVDDVDYRVDPARREDFAAAIRRYFPALEAWRLQPDYAGIRTRASPDSGFADFVIQNGAELGWPGLIQLFGIESPGLTASLSMARSVAQIIADRPTQYEYRQP